MEDFEYSVEICDRDWECFFVECEECNLLPPSLAGVDDSGMSDIDDTASILAKRVQKVDPTAGFTEADRPIDGPPDCEGSPVEHYLSKHGVGGMESVLSGSEEDMHLQSVNIFFERLKNVTEAERLTDPSQVRDGKNREAIQKEEWCSDGQQASCTTLPKNIPKLNYLPARGETAVGKETTKPVITISNIMKTVKKDEPGSNISPEPAVFIIERACTETRVNEAAQQSQSHESPNGVETTTHTDKTIKVEIGTPLDDVKQEDLLTSQLTLGKRCSTESRSNVEMVTNVKWKEDPNVLQSDGTSTNKTASQELSPSGSIRRRRRKKRRLSVEPAECMHGYERQTDSEKELYAWRGGTGLCVSEDTNLFDLNEPKKNGMSFLTTYSATSNHPVKISAQDLRVNDLSHYSPPCYSQYQYLPESIDRQGRCKATGSAENNATYNRSATPLSQSDDSVTLAPNNSGNVATNILSFSKLQVEESTGLNTHPVLPVSITDGVTGKSDLTTETANCEREDTHAESLRQSDKVNHPIICGEHEHNPESCTGEVTSLTHSISPSAESNDPAVEVIQKDKLSAAKSVLAVEVGTPGRDNRTLCQKEAEPQQQLEFDCHYTDQYSSTLEKTHFPLTANHMSSSDTHNSETKQFKTTASPFLEVISTGEDCAELPLDTSNSLTDKCCLSESMNITAEQTKSPLVLHALSKFDVLSEKNTTAERAELAGSQIMALHSGNPFLCGEINRTGKSRRETKMSMSEDLPTSLPDITPVSSCCTLDTESVMSLSNENITDVSGSSCISVKKKTSLILAKHEEGDDTSGPKSQSDTTDSKCDSVVEAADAITASKAGCEPEKAPDAKHSVFAMSSFWNEMERLTINDILGLRMMSKATPPSSLTPLQESEETDVSAMTDSGFFTQLDESKPEQTNYTYNDPNSVEPSSGLGTTFKSSSSRGVMWESESTPVSLGADNYTENMMLTSVSTISQPVLPGSAQTGLRKICKNVSVHNLHALETINYTWKGQTLQTLDEGGEFKKVKEYFTDGHKQDKDVDCLAPSSTDSYRISLTDIFQYLFGGKQSNQNQPDTDNITTCYTDGNSVPETYDHFFSEFDTETFFYPLITAEDQAKDELVPIFSCSRSANLQFPEAYDHFFASSSSDEDSDEEDTCGPVRVVNRFSRTPSASKISDVYENFFTDGDLKQNFFWKNTLSFRNIRFTGSPVQKEALSNTLVPVKQSGRSLRRTVHPINALGNQDVMFSDPLLYHLEERISRQLEQQPFRYGDLETAVSNPRLDASLLPLRQSDMCLVCIAFASWVLKTANPQVGDTWKAVLLANVSALSAIRYLRKYVKIEAAAGEKKLNYPALTDS
ncbi:PGC-1 and ERR-induced regulator in muscle protein 1 [Morone saxatilis]|uniref:PGC-1 and ERR-induced regulator in muscle protein 1 n=1 Tax=Morone saxatilis TaxID=34816 RepID=UPI0015E1FCCA|nr:PGC-1 and ERR-induced regulator in muscle protein 1 [Morone saxatilis]